jgi:hypothetical protein
MPLDRIPSVPHNQPKKKWMDPQQEATNQKLKKEVYHERR